MSESILQRSWWNVYAGLSGYGDSAGLGWIVKLPMAAASPDQEPSVILYESNQFSDFHETLGSGLDQTKPGDCFEGAARVSGPTLGTGRRMLASRPRQRRLASMRLGLYTRWASFHQITIRLNEPGPISGLLTVKIG